MNTPRLAKLWAYTAIIIAVIIWGSSFLIKPPLFPVIDPVQMVFIQCLCGASVLAGLNLAAGKKMRAGRSEVFFIMVSGTMGIAIYQVMLNFAIGLVGGVVCAVFAALIPAMCLLADVLIFKRALNVFSAVSIVLSFIGVMLIVSMTGAGDFNLAGYLLMLTTNVVWIYYCFFVNRRQTTVTSTVFLFYQLVGCTIILTPYMLLHPLDVAVLADRGVLWRLAFLVFLHGLLVYAFFIYAVGVLDVVVTNIAVNLIPIVTLLCNYVFLHELLAPAQMAGAVLVIAAVTLSSRAVGR